MAGSSWERRSQFIIHLSRQCQSLLFFISLIALAPIMGCAFSSTPHNPPPSQVSIALSPTSSSLFLGQAQQFTATVSNASDTPVTWSVDGIPGGNAAVGTIVSAFSGANTATYTAPQILPSDTTLNVTATSQADPTVSGSSKVQIQSNISVSVAPTSANLDTNAALSFTATVTGTGNPNIAVTWSVNGMAGGNPTVGTVVSTSADTAIYSAPAAIPSPPTVSVEATSIADPSKSASANVTITCAPSSSLSPPAASVSTGDTQDFAASLCASPGGSVLWDVNGVIGGNASLGTITPSGANPSDAAYTAPAAVPATNPVTIHAIAGGQSASATVTIVQPPIVVTVSPPTVSVAISQRASFAATVTGTLNSAVTWTVNGMANGNSTFGQVCAPSSNPCVPPTGNESNVDFLAPASQPQPPTVTLTAASVANPSSTGSAQITIKLPPPATVSIAPFYTFLDPSQQFQFAATLTGSVNQSVTWSVSSAVPGQGCSGAACGTIDTAGNYTAPAVAPSPNAISVIATSVANPSVSAIATVALLSGPVIETILPSSVLAGAPNSFLLAVQGLNFIPTSSSGSSQLLINGSPRATTCSTAGRCTTTLAPSDVASEGAISVQIANPGAVPALSNPVAVIVLSPPSSNSISLTSSSPIAVGENIIVTEPTTAGATPSPVNIDFAGPMSPDGSTCTIQASPIIVNRPGSGTTTASICVHGNYLDPTLTYAFSSPSTGGDIGVVPSSIASLFPNLIELTLTFSSSTAPGVRTLFVTTPNGDVAIATGLIEVK
jgi:hypothetical protein